MINIIVDEINAVNASGVTRRMILCVNVFRVTSAENSRTLFGILVATVPDNKEPNEISISPLLVDLNCMLPMVTSRLELSLDPHNVRISPIRHKTIPVHTSIV